MGVVREFGPQAIRAPRHRALHRHALVRFLPRYTADYDAELAERALDKFRRNRRPAGARADVLCARRFTCGER